MTRLLHMWQRLVTAGATPESSREQIEQIAVGNLTMWVIAGFTAVFASILLGLGALELGLIAMIASGAFGLGYVLSLVGRPLVGRMWTFIALNATIVLLSQLGGRGVLDTAHVATMCIAFLLFGYDRSRVLLAAVAIAVLAAVASQLPLLAMPLVPVPDSDRTTVRGVLTIMTTLFVALAVGYFMLRRRHTLIELNDALDVAETANRAKDEFLSNMSHELRTPMNGVMGMLDALLDSRLSDHQRDWAQTARGSGQSLLAIIDDVLELSKVDAGDIELVSAPFDLRETVERVVEQASVAAARKQLALTVDYESDAPRRVIGDPGRVRQIVSNLVSNAIKFTERGRVQVSVTALPRDGREVVMKLAVRDTGIGVPDSERAAIFRRFTQLDSSSTRAHGGTGLGLAICREFVDLMRGHIEVDSEVDRGTTVWFAIPMVVAPERDAPAVDSPDAALDHPAHGSRVLVVEDNAINQRVAAKMLTKLGCRVELVRNGREAVEAVAASDYAVVFMDVHMPVMDGFEATAAIRARERTSGRRVPIVAITARAMHGDRARCMAAGMDDYLSKPIQREELASALARVLHSADDPC